MRNITSDLIHKTEFAHVRFITNKRKEIASAKKPVGIDNSKPFTFDMSARISRDRRTDQNAIQHHLFEVANM